MAAIICIKYSKHALYRPDMYRTFAPKNSLFKLPHFITYKKTPRDFLILFYMFDAN